MNDVEIHNPLFENLISPDAVLTKLHGGMGFTEGPVWSDAGRELIFSDIPGNTMYRWTADDGVTTFRKPSGSANGNTRDREGRLLTCHHGSRSVTCTEPDGSVTTLADKFQGRRLNSPNDIVVDSTGAVWFTDPTYGIGSNQHDKAAVAEQDRNYVFRLNPDGSLEAMIDDFDMPNGLAFSPDESKLYVSDTGEPRWIRVFDMDASRAPINGRLFVSVSPGLPDGFRVDLGGNVWTSAGDGVHCYDSNGNLLGKVRVPETVANLEFGGSDGTTMFMTASASLYSIQTATRSARRW